MTATAKKTTKLMLTSPKKMGKAKRAPVTTTTEELRETLAASIELAAAQAPAVTGLDGDAAIDAASIGELVRPVQAPTVPAPKAKVAKAKPAAKAKAPAKAKKIKAAKPAPEAKTDHGPTLLALLSRPERACPREMMDATGLTHSGLKVAVTRLLREQGLKIILQRNPAVDPQDRALTSYLYTVEPK